MHKPLGNKYIVNPLALGKKIRNRRLELELLQKDVAHILHTSVDTITNWENENAKPHISFYPAIISFLGYFPFQIERKTFGEKILYYRCANGLTQEEFAKKIGINESTIFHYEKGTHKPHKAILKKVEELLNP